MKTLLLILIVIIASAPAQSQNVVTPNAALDRLRPTRSAIRQDLLRLRTTERNMRRDETRATDKKRKTPKAKRKLRRSRN